MKITFLGTRGNIDAKSRRHRRHTITVISYRGKSVFIDCGVDWLKKIYKLKPDAIVLTHAHPDHVGGLAHGAPCPVYATAQTWEIIKRYPIEKKYVVMPRKLFKIGAISFEVFPVDHSLNAPAVGYRIKAGKVVIFCVHDLVKIKQQRAALSGIKLYVGDGASIIRPIIRKRDSIAIGHTPITTQLKWCQKEKVPEAIFTHCGSQIVKGDERSLGARVRGLGRQCGVKVRIAYDGMIIKIIKSGRKK